jgi:hypothetical protein
MNTKTMMIKRVPWVVALLVAAVIAAPAGAADVTDDIRVHGKVAIDAMRADIRPSLPGMDAVLPAQAGQPLSVEQSIRANGRLAMRTMARDLDPVQVAVAVGPPQVLEQSGLVTASASPSTSEVTGSESL